MLDSDVGLFPAGGRKNAYAAGQTGSNSRACEASNAFDELAACDHVVLGISSVLVGLDCVRSSSIHDSPQSRELFRAGAPLSPSRVVCAASLCQQSKSDRTC